MKKISNIFSYHKIQTKQHVYLFLALLVIAFLLRISHGRGLSFADDFAYINAALNANEIGWSTYLSSLSTIYESRIGVVFPLAFFIKIFGASEGVILSLSLLSSLGTILCTFLLGMILHNSRTGLIAALIITFIPQDIWYSTATLPDVFIPLYTGLALLCLAAGLKYKQKGPRELLLYIFSGLFVFCAFETRVTSAIMILPLIAVAICSKQRNLRAIIVPAVTFCVAFVFFWSILFLVSGDFFLMYKILTRFAAKTIYPRGKFFAHLFHMIPFLKLSLNIPQLLNQKNLLTLNNIREYLLNPNFGLLFYLFWPAFFYSLRHIRKYEGCKLPLLSFVLPYLFLEFASTSLTSYRPIWKVDRYLTILSIPSALLIAFAVEGVLQIKPVFRYRSYLKKAIVLLIIAYLLVSIAMLVVADTWRFSHVQTYTRTFKQLKTLNLPTKRIYVMHRRWRLRGEVMMRLSPSSSYEFLFFKGVPVESIHRAIVIFDPTFFTDVGDYIEGESRMGWEEFDPAFKSIPSRLPEGWKLLFIESRHMGRGRKSAEVYVLYAP